MSHPKFSRLLVKDLVQRVGTRLSLQATVDQQEEKVFFEWRGPSGWSEDERVVITESGNTSICDITSLHLKDEGVWICSAKNKHGVSQTSCNVLTQVPKSYKAPTFLEELEAVLTEQGTVSLECKVVGIPSPTLTWYRDANQIRSGDVFALQANLSVPVSVYRCDATNCCGTAQSQSILDISKSLTSKACSAPTLDEPLQDRKVKIGELVELSILVSRMSLPVRVVWWNHGSQIAVGDKYSLVENAAGRYSAIINPVELCDDGVWKVSVDNKYGSVSSECTLTLRVPKNYRKPRFLENLKAVLTKEGLVSFECKVVGYPTPLLRWFKDGAELKPGDVYQLSGTRSLGTYSCLARNCMGEAVSTASLTVEDIGEKFPDTKSDLRFLVPVKDASVKIGDTHRFSTQVTYSPSLEITWRHADQHISNNDKYKLTKEDGGFFHCDILSAIQEDQGEWTCEAKDSSQNIQTSCSLVITVPKHYKTPRFLEPLKAVLTEEGAVNLECKVIGVPQPALTWFKDGVELKAGDIHRLMSGADGSCCLGTYTCVATNCMGSVTSSAALLGFEENAEPEVPEAPRQELMTPDMSDGTIKPFSLSTIQEERTSQMLSPEAAETIRQQSLEQDDIGELSISIGNQEVSLSLYQTPDLSAKDAQNICEMFADQLMESISESNVVELPPLRFMKETAKAANISMEAVVIDIDEQDLEDYESLKNALENVDDLKTEADYDDVSICDWVEEPVKVMEYDVITCDAVEEVTTNVFTSDILKDTGKLAEEEVQIINEKEVKTEEKFMRTDSYNKDSESIPDMEICTADENSKPIYEDKHMDEDDLDLAIEFRRERRKSSYDETLANMDPELLKELGLLPPDQESKEQPESLDLSQLPSETPEDRISRIEAKAQKIIAEDDSLNRQRSRSRSRSKSRPPSLDTVQELKTDEIREAKYYEDKNNGFLAQPSLDTIKESPSNVSVAGLLAGGFSSASINQDLQQGPGSPCIAKKETGAKQIEKKIEREENKIEEEDIVVPSENQKDNVDCSITETIEISEIMEEITLTEMHARDENIMDERCAEQEISEKENKKKKKLVDGMENEAISEVESQDDAFIEAFKVKLTEDAFTTKHDNEAKENQEREIITSIDRTSIDTADAIDQLDKSLSISQSKQFVDENIESKIMDDGVKPSEEGPDKVDNGEVPLMKKEDNMNEINKVNSEETQNGAIEQKAKDAKQLTEESNSRKLVDSSQNIIEDSTLKHGDHILTEQVCGQSIKSDEISLTKEEPNKTIEDKSDLRKSLGAEDAAFSKLKQEEEAISDSDKKIRGDSDAEGEKGMVNAEKNESGIQSSADAKRKSDDDNDTSFKKKQEQEIDSATKKKQVDKQEEGKMKILDVVAKKKEEEKTVGPTNKEAKEDAAIAAEVKIKVGQVSIQKKSMEESDTVTTNKKVGIVSAAKGKDEEEASTEKKNVEAEACAATKRTDKNTSAVANKNDKEETNAVSSNKNKGKINEEDVTKEKIEQEAGGIAEEEQGEAEPPNRILKKQDTATIETKKKAEQKDGAKAKKKSEEEREEVVIMGKKKAEKEAADVLKMKGEEEASVAKTKGVEEASSKKKDEEEVEDYVAKKKADEEATKKKNEEGAITTAKKKKEEAAAFENKKAKDEAAFAKKKEEEEAVAAKKEEEEGALAVAKKEEDEAAAFAKKKAEEVVAATKKKSHEEASATEKKAEEDDLPTAKLKQEEKAAAAEKKVEEEAAVAKNKVDEEKVAIAAATVAKTKEEEKAAAARTETEEEAYANAKKKAEEEAGTLKKGADEEAGATKNKKEEDAIAAAKKKAEEETRDAAKKTEELEAVDALKNKIEDEVAAARKKAYEETAAVAKKNEEEKAVAARKKNEEESAAKKKKADDETASTKKMKEEDAKKKEEEAATLKKQADEEAATIKKKKEEDAITSAKNKAEEEAATKKNADEETAGKKKTEEDAAAKKNGDEEAAAASKKKEEEKAVAAKKKTEEEAAAKKKKADDEAAATKKKKEEDAIPSEKKKAEEEASAKKKADEEAASKKKTEEEASAKKKAEEEAAAKKKADEAAAIAKKMEEEKAVAAKKKADEEAAAVAKKKEEEKAVAAKKKIEEEVAAKKKKADDEAAATKKKNKEDAIAFAKKKEEEEAATLKKQADEEAAAIKKKEEDATASAKKKAEEEAVAKKKADEEAAAKKKNEEEAAAKKKADEDNAAEKKKIEEEAYAKKKTEKEASEKKKADEETAAIQKKKEEEAAAVLQKKEEEKAAAAKKKIEEEAAAKKKKADDEASATKKKIEEEAIASEKKKAEEEAAAKKKADEEAASKKKTEEEGSAKKKAEEDSAAKKKADEAAAIAKKMEEEKASAAKKKADEEAAAVAKKKEEEKAATLKKQADEEAAAIKKKEEDAIASAKKKAEEEAAAKKKADEEAAAKKKNEKEAAAKKKADEEDAAAKKKIEEEAYAKKKTEKEAAAKKKADEEIAAIKEKKEEEAAAVLQKKEDEKAAAKKKKIEEAAAAKKKNEEEAAKKKKTEEEAAAEKKAVEKDAAAKKKIEEEAAAKKKADEEAAAKKKIENEVAAKKKADEEAGAIKRKKEEEAAALLQKKEDEKAAMMKKKIEVEAAAKKKTEEEASEKKKTEENAAAKKKADEKAALMKKKDDEAAAKKKTEEEAAAKKKKKEEDAIAAAKKKAEEEAATLKKRADEEAVMAKKKADEETAVTKRKTEEDAIAAAKKKAEEEADTLKKGEKDSIVYAKKKAEDAAVAKKKEVDDAAATIKKAEEKDKNKITVGEASQMKLEEGSLKINENMDDIKKVRKEGKKKTGAKKSPENGIPLKDASESPKRQKKNDSNVVNTSDTLTRKNISQSRTISSNIPSQNIMDDVYQEKNRPISSQMPDNGLEYSVDRQRTYQPQDGSMGYSVERQKETHTARECSKIQEKTSSAYSQNKRDGLQMQENVSIYSPKTREITYSHNEHNYSSSMDQGSYKSDMYKGAMSPVSERRFGGNFCVDSDYQDVRLSTASESRSKQHSKEDHFKETVGKSLQTSHNLMSIAQEVVHPKVDQQSRVKPSADPRSKKKQQECTKSTLKSKLALEDASGPSVPGGVSQIMIKEVGTNWASLCWKKPSVTRGSPVITYKVEAWLCGEGAFWVEIGRTPIPQFDAFNLKANKCYHFRVTARNRRGWGDSIMTSHKVDLNKPTQMPKIQTDMETVLKCLYKSPVKLSIQVTGEPAPEVVWQRGNTNIAREDGLRAYSDISGHHLEIDCVDTNTTGKYNVVASNMAGKASKSITIQAVYNTDVFNAYQQFKRWQSLVTGPLGPFFVNGPRDRRVQCGQSIQLTCRVVGNPWPKTRWFKDSQEIVPDEYTTVYNEGDFQHVNMDDVITEHSGRYSVEAFNEHGVIKEYFTLIVDNGLERYMPPFFTKELPDMIVHKGCNLLLHCRVESYPYIGVTWHASGAKVRLKETDYKLIDEDGNVVLVLSNVEHDCAYTCSIINEVAENTTTCAVTVTTDKNKLHAIQDEDVIRHSVTPMFTSWPPNPVVEEGADIHLECQVERCTSLFLSREFLPTSIDVNVVKFSKGSGSSFMTDLRNVGPEQAGLYFMTARNSTCETKYPLVIKVKATHNLTNVHDCAIDQSSGAPRLAGVGVEQMFARDGDDAIIKVSLQSGEAPFNISWTLNQQPMVWTDRVVPYNREGCVGIKIVEVGIEDEGVYSCTITNSAGQATKQITFVVDYADHKESELMVEICNCPMLDSLTPLMSWTNTPIGTPRRTPLPNPHLTPLCTPRATPRSTPRTTPRATPQRLFTTRDFRDSYRSVGSSSPGRIIEDIKAPPQRKRFVQAPEIFSSFSSKTVEEGQAVELKCFISCAPLTTTTWEKDGHPIMSGAHTTLSEKTGVRALTVAGVTLNDTGVYKMTITNASGVANCSATLNVKPAKLSRGVGGLSSPLVARSLYSPYNSSYGRYSSSLSRNMRSSSRYL